MPLVTVILTTYKEGRPIEDSVNSVLEQTFTDFEFIIIDESPTDKICKIISQIEKKDKRVRCVRNKTRMGFSNCLNQGIKLARGEYIARIDDDDVWCDPKKLEKQIDFFKKNKEYVLVGTGAIYVDKNTKELYRVLMPESDGEIRKTILYKNCFIHSSVMFSKEAAVSVGCYDPLAGNEDFDLWLKLGTVGKLYNLPEYLVKFRCSSEHPQISKIRRSRTKALIANIKKYKNNYPGYGRAEILNFIKLTYTYLPKPKILENYLYKKRQVRKWRV